LIDSRYDQGPLSSAQHQYTGNHYHTAPHMAQNFSQGSRSSSSFDCYNGSGGTVHMFRVYGDPNASTQWSQPALRPPAEVTPKTSKLYPCLVPDCQPKTKMVCSHVQQISTGICSRFTMLLLPFSTARMQGTGVKGRVRGVSLGMII